jgi:hypothetical protein
MRKRMAFGAGAVLLAVQLAVSAVVGTAQAPGPGRRHQPARVRAARADRELGTVRHGHRDQRGVR